LHSFNEVAEEILKALDNEELRRGLTRSLINLSENPIRVIENWKYLTEYAKYVRSVKERTLKNLDYYIDETIKNIEKVSGHGYLARTRDEALKIIDEIIGDPPKLIVKAKSMVTEEIGLRGYLIRRGYEVYETDLGELLIQLSNGKPMHSTAPAVHIPRERAVELLNSAGVNVDKNMPIPEVIRRVRLFLRKKFINADIGISGANVVAADTGTIFLISNEGNIRHVTNLPEIHISITGVEKIMPTMKDAFLQALVQAGYAGLYPPTYLSLISGPSSTADIEHYRVYGAHGPKEVHLILYDGGRMSYLGDPILYEQLYCIRCGRCQQECPVWDLVGNIWGGSVYGGPMGIGWTAITESLDKAMLLSHFCLNCGRCMEACPMEINMPRIIRSLKKMYFEKKFD